jgi:hypothetical protein
MRYECATVRRDASRSRRSQETGQSQVTRKSCLERITPVRSACDPGGCASNIPPSPSITTAAPCRTRGPVPAIIAPSYRPDDWLTVFGEASHRRFVFFASSSSSSARGGRISQLAGTALDSCLHPVVNGRNPMAGISNRESPEEEANERREHPPINTDSAPSDDAAGHSDDERTDLQTSHKSGSRSTAQKEADR